MSAAENNDDINESPEEERQRIRAQRLRNLKFWVPGKTGNPAGRPKNDPLLLQIREFSEPYVREIIAIAMMATARELKEIAEDAEQPATKACLARAIWDATQDGNWKLLEEIFDRVLPKQITGMSFNGQCPSVVVNIPPNNREVPKLENGG